jgi:hypothetical protein
MNNNDEREEVELILPASVMAELQARAAKEGCTIEALIDQADDRTMARPQLALHALLLRVQAIDEALASGEPPPWPASFDECLEVSVLLGMWQKQSSETLLLETNGPEMSAIEEICRAEGISYEEFTRRAIDAKLYDKNPEHEDGLDEADWWKAP